MAIKIYKEGYIPGAYTRKALTGYLQFHQWGFYTTTGDVTISADRTRGARLFSDSIAAEWKEKGVWNRQQYHEYMKAFEEFFDFERLKDQTDEQILYSVEQLRQGYLTYAAFDKAVKWRQSRFLSLDKLSHTLEANEDCYFNRKLIAGDQAYCVNGEVLEEIHKEISHQNRLVVFADNHQDLHTLLGMLGPFSKEQEIIVFVKNNSLMSELSCRDFNLKGLWPFDATLRIEMCSSSCAGFDLRDKSLCEKLDPYLKTNTPVLVIGETAVLTFEGASFKYTAILPLRTDKACKYAGLLPSFQEKKVRVLLKKVDPNWDYPFEKQFSGVERSTFNLISDVEHDKNYYMNMYSSTYDSENFPEFKIQENSWDEIMKERKRNLLNVIQHQYGERVKAIHKVYQQPGGELIRFEGILFNDSKRPKRKHAIKVEPVLAQNENKELIDIREFAKGVPSEKPVFLVNFLYFATQKLMGIHDSNRYEKEKVEKANFFIDGLYDATANRTTFPLYNKAFVGESKEGLLTFGTQVLKSGTIKINEFETSWDEEAVKSETTRDFIIYTPHLSKQDIGNVGENFHQYHKQVGERRINLLVVNDRLICARKGSLNLSPFGVVLSFQDKFEEKLVKEIGLKKAENGYYKLPEHISISLRMPENDSYRWKYNGANLLFKNGINLMADEATAREEFLCEGWYDPFSMQTQETQVQQWVRGPRAVIGVDKENNPFLGVVSGRTKVSVGARFDELTTILKDNIPAIKDAINLDGGASSCLGMIYKHEFFELSLPCCTAFTTTGMARPVNSLLLVEPI